MFVMEVDQHVVKDSTIDEWHKFFVERLKDYYVSKGAPRERLGTVFFMESETLARIFALAKYGAKMKRSKGKQTKVAVAAELRRLANAFDPPPKPEPVITTPTDPVPGDE